MDFDVWDNDNSILFLVFLPATHPPGPMKKKKEFVVVQSLSCPTLCDPVDCSKPDSCPSLSSGVCSDSCPLWWWCYHILCHLFFFFPLLAFSLFQHQSLFQWVGSSHQVAKVLEFQLQHNPSNEYSGLISFRIDWCGSPCCPKVSRVFSNITIWKRQFFSTQPSLWSNSHICTWLLEKP